MYYSDWIENTGIMPLSICSETLLEVKYTDGVTVTGIYYNDGYLWELNGGACDIYMYRYIYNTVDVAQEASE